MVYPEYLEYPSTFTYECNETTIGFCQIRLGVFSHLVAILRTREKLYYVS